MAESSGAYKHIRHTESELLSSKTDDDEKRFKPETTLAPRAALSVTFVDGGVATAIIAAPVACCDTKKRESRSRKLMTSQNGVIDV